MEQPQINESQQPASGRAIATFVMGLLAVLCAGFLTGIPAFIYGSAELKAIKDGMAPKSGEGLTKAGYALGIIGTVLSCLGGLIFILIMVGIISMGTSSILHNFQSVM